MISVDFEKLKELYEIVNRFQGTVSENLSRAEAETSGITADGDKLIHRLNEIRCFLDDEITRYQRVERKLNEKANAITFRGSRSLKAVYINNISESSQSLTVNPNAALFKSSISNDNAAAFNMEHRAGLKSEDLVNRHLKASEEKVNSTVNMVENAANELKNFVEDKINEMGKIENFIEGKIDEILGALVKELDSLESEIYKALSDKNLQGINENGVNLVKIKVEEFFNFDKGKSKELSKEEEKYKNNLEEDWNNFKSNVWNEFKKAHPEVARKLEEIKNQIEAELKTAWENFEKKYPLVAQVLKVSYKAVKGIIEGGIDVGKGLIEAPFQLLHSLGEQLYDFKENPLGTLKKWFTTYENISTLLNGTPPVTEEQVKFRAGLIQMVRTSIDKNIIHGDAESRARFTVNVAGNIAIFVFTDGAGAASKAGEAEEALNAIEKTEDALSTAQKAEEVMNTAEKAEEAMNVAEKADGLMQKADDLVDIEEIVTPATMMSKLDIGFGRDISQCIKELDKILPKVEDIKIWGLAADVSDETKAADIVSNVVSKAVGAEEKVKSVESTAASIGKEDKVADKAVSEAGDFDKTAGTEGKYSGEGVGKENIKGAAEAVNLWRKSACSNDELYNYLLKNVNSDVANNFLKEGIWPEGIQIPKNSSVLSPDGSINWSKAAEGGYILKADGTAIKEQFIPEMGEAIDRYGNANGRYTSPVINGQSYSYTERSLPYVEDLSNYHRYEVVGDFTKIKEYVDKCTDIKLKTEIETTVRKYYKGDYSRLASYKGNAAAVEGWGKGGAIQYEFSLTVEQLKGLGLLKEIK